MRRLPLLLLALSPILLVLAGGALWCFWPSPPPPQTLEANIGGRRLHFAAAYLREGPPEPDRVDLVVLAPDFTPAGGDPHRIPGPVNGRASPAALSADKAGAAQIFITLTPAAAETAAGAPADRYGPFLEPDVQVTEGGLIRRRFEEKSPFAGEDFYYNAPDGQEFSARCQRQRIPADGLPDVCLTHLIVDGLDLALRFDPVWLPQWPSLRANAQLLARGALAP